MAVVDEQTEPVRRFVLNTEATVEVHIPALDAVDDQQGVRSLRLRSVDRDRVFPTLPTAVAAYEAWCATGDLPCQAGGRPNGPVGGREAPARPLRTGTRW
ncbi:hypothetical protein ACIQWL_20930 [Streptomyces mirabilis]|jgi:hypothetical protein|uniref:hypothetical protein n=1 Tax=Streptomyces mirabilis TaxID=68239 RepID=UPI0006BA7C0F|nr:hypothetical protein OK006_4326 [Actinobacteria bacterium OK006]